MLVFASPKHQPGYLIRLECANEEERDAAIERISEEEKSEVYWASYVTKGARATEREIDKSREDFNRFAKETRLKDGIPTY